MEQGSLPERYLSRSVLKHIRRQRKEQTVAAAVGNDYSEIELNQEMQSVSVVTADGISDFPYLAWVKATNNFACSGGNIVGARILMLLPKDAKESHLKEYMACFNQLSEEQSIQILGGHTQVSEALVRPQFFVTLIGISGRFQQKKKSIKPGYDIVMAGYTGLLGTNLILKENHEALAERFAKSYLKEAYFEEKSYSIKAMVDVAQEVENNTICYMHDVSKGGIYGALWQLGVWMDKGFEVFHQNIIVKQETIELCEYFNINPYLLEGTGAVLFVLQQGDALVNALRKKGFSASIIGKVVEGKEKMIVMNDVDRRCLSPVNGDEIFHINKMKRGKMHEK